MPSEMDSAARGRSLPLGLSDELGARVKRQAGTPPPDYRSGVARTPTPAALRGGMLLILNPARWDGDADTPGLPFPVTAWWILALEPPFPLFLILRSD